ncbi:hypothetical protein M9Y10_028393 [Tritrichomonas musculus]|uniref:Choline transporter-like protein n=1 Tax=Tritrichomonas musculus TaxID=1915356 RepID=A0ABR2KJ91_9EUKA
MSHQPVEPSLTENANVSTERNNYYASVQQGFYYSYYIPQGSAGFQAFDPQTSQYPQAQQAQQNVPPPQAQQYQQYPTPQPVQQYQQYPTPQQGVPQQQYIPQEPIPDQGQTSNGNSGFFSRFNNLKPTIVYQNITVEQWSTVQCEETMYSKYWDSPESFEPETFSENVKSETKWNDLGWMIAFWVNFLIFFILFIVIAAKGTKASKTYFDGSYSKVLLYYGEDDDYGYGDDYDYDGSSSKSSSGGVPKNIMGYTVGLGLVIGLVLNAIHSVYILFLPNIYIHFGFFICILISFLCIIPALALKLWAALLLPAIVAIICLIAYCCLKKYILISAQVLKYACRLLWKNPTLFIVYLIQAAVQVVLAILFIVSIVYIVIIGWSFAIIIYYLFSFYWMSLTSTYVIYLITAGVAAQEYFLAGTEYMPKMAVWASTKRAMTTSFGSASFAGFLIAIINILEEVVYYALDSDSTIVNIIALIAMCVLACIRCCIDTIARNALIYCATFGIPFLEGCRRWLELDTSKFIGTIVNNVIISSALNLHLFAFTFGAALIGLGIGYGIGKGDAFTMVLMFFACSIYFLLLFDLLNEPLITLADTLFVCFAECPQILKIQNNELYEKFVAVYGDELGRHL